MSLCKHLATCLVLALSPMARAEVQRVERELYAPLLTAEVNFDDVNSSRFPGIGYGGRFSARGLVASTHFNGQTPVLKGEGRSHTSHTA